MPKTDSFVIVKGSGGAGLGDRMCGLAVGILYARHTGRILHADWRDRAFGTQQRNLFPELLRVDGVPVCERFEATGEVAPKVWAGRLELSLDQLRALDLEERAERWTGEAPPWDRDEAIRRYSIDVSNFDYPDENVVVWSGASINALTLALNGRGVIDDGITADFLLGDTIRRHIRFEPEIQCRVQQFYRDVIDGRPSLGVHYRRTDEAAAVRSLPSQQQYLRATDAGLTKLPSDAVIFLATDNRDVQQLYLRRYGQGRVRWLDKWLPEGGSSIHKNNYCPDGVAAAKAALVDVGILASCDRLVLTGNSSFSSLAGWFSDLQMSHCELLFPGDDVVARRVLRKMKRLVRLVVSKGTENDV